MDISIRSLMVLPSGFFNEANMMTYKGLMQQVPMNGIVVELGCWKGRSICSVAEVIRERNLNVILVDTFKGTQTIEEKSYFKEAETEDIRQLLNDNLYAFGIRDYATVLEDTTNNVVERIDGLIDFVFIDADHSYEAVKTDITNWLPKVKSGGMIAGHDFGRPEVKRAISETIGQVEVDNSQSNIWFKRI